MTSSDCNCQKSIDFSQQDKCLKWSKGFKRFRQVLRLLKEDQESQINTLIYTIGDQADNILNSFNLTIIKMRHIIKMRLDEHFVGASKVQSAPPRRRDCGYFHHCIACDGLLCLQNTEGQDDLGQNCSQSLRCKTFWKASTWFLADLDKSNHPSMTKWSCQKTTSLIEKWLWEPAETKRDADAV